MALARMLGAMDLRRRILARFAFLSAIASLLCFGSLSETRASNPSKKQDSLDRWRLLTATNALAPRVFVKGESVRFFFETEEGIEAFSAHWSHLRIPTDGYKANLAVLRWNQRLSHLPEREHSWREATVIAGVDWRQLATNLIAELTPQTPGHGAYYQAFLADRLLYRDLSGVPRSAAISEQPADIVIDHSYSIEETLDLLGRLFDQHLSLTHPGDSLFVLMAPNAKRFTQPLLLDRQQRRCVFLAPAALYDYTERGVTPSATAQGFRALLIESHGLAIIKNPLSSLARLADLGCQTLVRFVRLPLPKPCPEPRSTSQASGMNLAAWEKWLDRYTGTHREKGAIRLLIDGDKFFPRFQQAVAEATNHIHLQMYIFDRDDVAVAIADQLKQRAHDVDVKVIMDRMSTITAGFVPPTTPMPEEFIPPPSMYGYLQRDSRVQVRPFLNPWFSSDHAKVLLVDGRYAWLGGMNLGREYKFEWHDLMFEVQGPIVASLEEEFDRQWAHAGPWGDLGYTAALLGHKVSQTPASQSGPFYDLRCLPTKTLWKPFEAAVLGALDRGQHHVYVENPYLFDKRVIHGLVNARERGADVRVVLPRVNDFKAGGRGNIVIANYLLQRGVRVYFYPGMTHVKALLVDGWSCLGSANLNHLSLRVNQEQNIATSDPGFAADLRKDLFEADFARSYELTQPISVEWVDFLADLLLEGF